MRVCEFVFVSNFGWQNILLRPFLSKFGSANLPAHCRLLENHQGTLHRNEGGLARDARAYQKWLLPEELQVQKPRCDNHVSLLDRIACAVDVGVASLRGVFFALLLKSNPFLVLQLFCALLQQQSIQVMGHIARGAAPICDFSVVLRRPGEEKLHVISVEGQITRRFLVVLVV